MTCSSRRPGSCRGPCRSRIPLVRSALLRRARPGPPARRCTRRPRRSSSDEAAALRHRVAAAPGPDDAALRRPRPVRRRARPGARPGPAPRRTSCEAARLARTRARPAAPAAPRAVSGCCRRGDAATAETFADEIRVVPARARCATACSARWRWRAASRRPRRLFLRHAWERCGPDTDPRWSADDRAAVRRAPVRAAGRGGRRRVVSPGARPDRAGPATHADRADLPRPRAWATRAGSPSRSRRRRAPTGIPATPASAWLQPALGPRHAPAGRGRPRRRPRRPRRRREHGARGSASSTPPRSRSPTWPAPSTSRATGTTPSCTPSARSRSTTSRSSGSLQSMVVSIAALVPAARGDWAVAEAILRRWPARRAAGSATSVRCSPLAMSRARLAEARGDAGGVLAALAPVPRFPFRDAVDEPGFWSWQDLYAEALVATGRVAEADALPRPARGAGRPARPPLGDRAAGPRPGPRRGRGRPARTRAEEAFQRGAGRGRGRCAARSSAPGWSWRPGQFLRRAGQRRRAVDLLRPRHERVRGLGAAPYADRCATELAGSGLRPDGAAGTATAPR